jgi:hypothetical protein
MDEDLSGSSTPTGSVFVVRSSHVSLPRGHSMLWRTQLWRAQE